MDGGGWEASSLVVVLLFGDYYYWVLLMELFLASFLSVGFSTYFWKFPGDVWRRISLSFFLDRGRMRDFLNSLSRVLCSVFSSACFLFALQLHRFIACFLVFAQHLHCVFYFMLLHALRKRVFGFLLSVSAYHWRSCPAFFCFCVKNYLFSWGSVVPRCGSRSGLVYHTTSSIVSILRGGGGDFPT